MRNFSLTKLQTSAVVRDQNTDMRNKLQAQEKKQYKAKLLMALKIVKVRKNNSLIASDKEMAHIRDRYKFL